MSIIALLILILDIVALVDCLKSSRDSNFKLLWVVVIVLLPFLGMLLYFLIAKNQKTI